MKNMEYYRFFKCCQILSGYIFPAFVQNSVIYFIRCDILLTKCELGNYFEVGNGRCVFVHSRQY